MHFRILGLLMLATAAAGCSSSKIQLTAGPNQQAIVRNGTPALISRKTHVVMLRPNTRRVQGSSRPAFTIVVRNQSAKPHTLYETSIRANQVVAGKKVAIRAYRFEQLVQEEKTRQAIAALGAGLAGAASAMSAANAGYVNTTGTVNTYGPGGSGYGTYSATTYDPMRAQIAQQASANQTSANFAAISAQGEQNLAALEHNILKDNTVLPGEWYGGTVVFDPPQSTDGASTPYTLTVSFGEEEHEFQISHVKS